MGTERPPLVRLGCSTRLEGDPVQTLRRGRYGDRGSPTARFRPRRTYLHGRQSSNPTGETSGETEGLVTNLRPLPLERGERYGGLGTSSVGPLPKGVLGK